MNTGVNMNKHILLSILITSFVLFSSNLFSSSWYEGVWVVEIKKVISPTDLEKNKKVTEFELEFKIKKIIDVWGHINKNGSDFLLEYDHKYKITSPKPINSDILKPGKLLYIKSGSWSWFTRKESHSRQEASLLEHDDEKIKQILKDEIILTTKKKWQLECFEDWKALKNNRITLNFNDNTISGFVDKHPYSGKFSMEKDNIKFTEIKFQSKEKLNEMETKLIKNLSEINKFIRDYDREKLYLQKDDNTLLQFMLDEEQKSIDSSEK